MRYLIAVLLILLPFCLRAQGSEPEDSIHYPERIVVGNPAEPDSVDVARLSHKAFWRASAETVGFNIGLWAFDRYVQKGHFAYISWETIKENFRHGFEWDNDHLSTNMFAHPYNGSLFYNAGRSNGFNFWQSELFAIAGSAMWEMFMEREYPSTNDIIATPIGGAAIGETLYRTSDLVLDDRTTGWGRFGRELAAFVISPMRGFTRIVTGRAWQHRQTSGRRFGTPPISVEFSLGAKIIAFHHDKHTEKAGASARINIEYGDRFARETRTPYDYFSFLLELNAVKSQPFLSRLEIQGRLLSKRIVDTRHYDLSLGMYQHFDYFDSDTIKGHVVNHPMDPCAVPYKLGTPASVGAGLMARYQPSGSVCFDGNLHFNGVILAGVLSDYYRYYNRNYNWSSGLSAKLMLKCTLPKKNITVSVADQYYRLYTWGGYESDSWDWDKPIEEKPGNVQGDSSAASFNHFETRISYRFWERLSATFAIDWYYRNTRYSRSVSWDMDNMSVVTGMPIVISSQVGIQFMITYDL